MRMVSMESTAIDEGFSSMIGTWLRMTLRILLGLACVRAGLQRPRRRWRDEPRFNQIQVIGSHNSYHIAPDKGSPGADRRPQRRSGPSRSTTPIARSPSNSRNQGIRQVELDVYADPKGGLFATPAAREIVTALGKDPGEDPDANGLLEQARAQNPARA